MTYGYDATVVDWGEFLGKVSKNAVRQHAQTLLETLASHRPGETLRKVGNRIVKQQTFSNMEAASHSLRLSQPWWHCLQRCELASPFSRLSSWNAWTTLKLSQALVRSQQWASEAHLLLLCECTRGVIFLGTPHKGSELARWAKCLANVVGVVKQANSSIVRQLEKDSEELERIQDNFDILLRSREAKALPPIHIKCFFEEKPITGIGQVWLPSHLVTLH